MVSKSVPIDELQPGNAFELAGVVGHEDGLVGHGGAGDENVAGTWCVGKQVGGNVPDAFEKNISTYSCPAHTSQGLTSGIDAAGFTNFFRLREVGPRPGHLLNRLGPLILHLFTDQLGHPFAPGNISGLGGGP